MTVLRTLLRIVTNIPHVVVFMAYFFQQLVLANLRVAYEVATPGHNMRAGIVRVETRTRTDLELASLANAITMTPGTLSLEVDPEQHAIFVHTLYVDSREEFLAGIGRMETLLLKALR